MLTLFFSLSNVYEPTQTKETFYQKGFSLITFHKLSPFFSQPTFYKI